MTLDQLIAALTEFRKTCRGDKPVGVVMHCADEGTWFQEVDEPRFVVGTPETVKYAYPRYPKDGCVVLE